MVTSCTLATNCSTLKKPHSVPPLNKKPSSSAEKGEQCRRRAGGLTAEAEGSPPLQHFQSFLPACVCVLEWLGAVAEQMPIPCDRWAQQQPLFWTDGRTGWGWAILAATVYQVFIMCQTLPRTQASQSLGTIISPILQIKWGSEK